MPVEGREHSGISCVSPGCPVIADLVPSKQLPLLSYIVWLLSFPGFQDRKVIHFVIVQVCYMFGNHLPLIISSADGCSLVWQKNMMCKAWSGLSRATCTISRELVAGSYCTCDRSMQVISRSQLFLAPS